MSVINFFKEFKISNVPVQVQKLNVEVFPDMNTVCKRKLSDENDYNCISIYSSQTFDYRISLELNVLNL